MKNDKSTVKYRVLEGSELFAPFGINIRINKVYQTKGSFHTHDFFEFVYVEKGFMVHNHNGRTHILTAGDVLCIVPGQIHSYTMAYEATIYNILFDRNAFGPAINEISSIDILKDILSCNTNVFPVVKLNIPQRHEMMNMINKMVNEQIQTAIGWKTMLRVHTLDFLIFFARAYASSQRERAFENAEGVVYYGYILKTLKFIEDNFKNDITSSEIAENVGISSDYITKQFKKELEITPLEYLRKYRIAKAIELIKTTDMSISDISAECGFNDLSLFSRVFKHTFGLTPRDFKKEIQD
ncbi:MAG: helix-turn-helix domain-containing protein [Ruminococcaceae bacterium]|nr:helix-turn-helix domain-containing protein [Oscillospiraceae bacterium]